MYQLQHEVTYVCDEPDWCEDEVTDSLSIKQDGDSLQVKIELVQTNYHTCHWEGRLTQTARDKWGTAQDGCSVELTIQTDKLSVTSDGCRDYCGARAYLEEVFPRDNATAPGESPRD